MAASARWKRQLLADQVQGLYRASYKVEFFQGKDFPGGNLRQAQRLTEFRAQGLVGFMLRVWSVFLPRDWLVLMLSCSGAECVSLVLVSVSKFVSFTGIF